MGGAIAMGVVMLILAGVTIYLTGTLMRSIGNEKRAPMRIWKNFGLSLGFCVLFFITWVGQGIAQWQSYTDEARTHGETPAVGDYVARFADSTLENWQSEFLQLFSFTIMSAVLIHKGSAESRDSDDRIEAALKRIEDKLGTEPTLGEGETLRQGKDLHVVPDGFEGWALKDESASEPEGYYDTQAEAVAAGRTLAGRLGVTLHIHGEDGSIRDSSG